MKLWQKESGDSHHISQYVAIGYNGHTMACLKRVVACLAVAVNVLVAADSKLSIAMQKALDRIAKGEPGVVASGMRRPIDVTGMELRPHPVVLAALTAPSAEHVCSVPLLEMRIDHPERFTMLHTAATATNDPMPRAIVPAPAGEKDSR
jgi:hypothetical protein